MKRFSLIWVILLLVPVMIVTAQDEGEPPHPLFEMLALVPNSENALGSAVSYADYAALYDSRDYIPRADTAAELLVDEEQFRLWRLGMNRIRSGYSDLARLLRGAADIPEKSGFDLFDIERTLEFGMPPALGRIYGGNFDAGAINAALTERGYIATELVGFPAWCADEACEEGLRQDLVGIDPGDVFDPALGRKPTVLNLTERGFLASSPGKPAMIGVAIAAQATDANPRASVLGLPEYRTAAEVAAAPDGLLIQVQFWPGLNLLATGGGGYTTYESVDLSLFETRESFEENSALLPYFRESVIPAEWLAYGELPAYKLVAFVDRQEGEDQVAQVVVIYPSAELAGFAAAELETRIRSFSQQITFGGEAAPFIDAYLGQAVVESSVYTSEDTGLSAAVISVRYPVSENESEPITLDMADDEIPRVPGGLYIRWINALYARAFYPLWEITLPDWAYEDAE